MKKPAQHLIAEVPRRQAKVEMTIGIDLGDVWSHYCTLNQDGEVVDPAASELPRRRSRSGLPTWLQRGSRWRPRHTRSGSAHSCRSWVTKSSWRTLCHVNGGELEQVQFLLGHASVLTTERYLGCKQNLEEPVNDRFGSLFPGGVDSRQGLFSPVEPFATLAISEQPDLL